MSFFDNIRLDEYLLIVNRIEHFTFEVKCEHLH